MIINELKPQKTYLLNNKLFFLKQNLNKNITQSNWELQRIKFCLPKIIYIQPQSNSAYVGTNSKKSQM